MMARMLCTMMGHRNRQRDSHMHVVPPWFRLGSALVPLWFRIGNGLFFLWWCWLFIVTRVPVTEPVILTVDKKKPGKKLHVVTDSELVFLGLQGKWAKWERQ